MGWTLFACFGYTKKRKRPKRASKLASKSSRRRSRARGYDLYEPLQTDETLEELESSETLTSPRDKPKDEPKARIRKKVRFNLDVVTYEPLSSQDDDDEDDDEELDPLSKTISSTEAKLSLYPSDYRYNSYDGEDEYEYEHDHEDDYDSQISEEEDDENDYGDDDHGCSYCSQKLYYKKITEGELHDCSSMPLISSETNARLRSHYVVPVLNPIENLSQWKAVKIRKC